MSHPPPPPDTPSERVANAIAAKLGVEASFCPTIWLSGSEAPDYSPFGDTVVRMESGFFGLQVGDVRRSSESGEVFLHVVVHVPRGSGSLLTKYRDWLQERLVPWGALLVPPPQPWLCFNVSERVSPGPIYDDKKTFVSQRLVFEAKWEKLEVS